MRRLTAIFFLYERKKMLIAGELGDRDDLNPEKMKIPKGLRVVEVVMLII